MVSLKKEEADSVRFPYTAQNHYLCILCSLLAEC